MPEFLEKYSDSIYKHPVCTWFSVQGLWASSFFLKLELSLVQAVCIHEIHESPTHLLKICKYILFTPP